MPTTMSVITSEWARLSARSRAGGPHGLRSVQASMNKGISIQCVSFDDA